MTGSRQSSKEYNRLSIRATQCLLLEGEIAKIQVGKLVESIQQLQARVAELELQEVSINLQEVRDQREETARSAVERIKELALE
jgi:hypothetical protein